MQDKNPNYINFLEDEDFNGERSLSPLGDYLWSDQLE